MTRPAWSPTNTLGSEMLELPHHWGFVLKPWKATEIASLGKASDYELGRRFGRSTSGIHCKREQPQRKIPAAVLRWKPGAHALPGTDTDQNIARLVKQTEDAVKEE